MSFFSHFFPNSFSTSDKLIASSAIFVCSLSLYVLLNSDFAQNDSSLDKVALLIEKTNNVTHKRSKSVSFQNSEQGASFENDDEVFVGENSEAKIQFIKSKTEVIAPSRTLLRIGDGKKGEKIAVKDGLAQFIIQKGKKLTVELNGQTNEFEATDESQKVEIILDKNGELKLKTLSGQEEFSARNKIQPTVITHMDNPEEDENSSLPEQATNKENAPIKKESKEFNLISPKEWDKFNPSSGILFSWQGSKKIDISISKTQDFAAIIDTISFETSPKRWPLKLDSGDYFLKIKSEGKEKIVTINLASEIAEKKISPSSNENMLISPNDSINFKWPKLAQNDVILFIKNHENKELKIKVSGNEYSLEKPKGKKFEWAILKESEEGKSTIILGPFHFTISYNGKINLLHKRKENSHFFTWNSLSEERFKIIITNSEDSNYVFTKDLSTPELNFQTEKAGSFNVILESIDYPREKKTEYSFDIDTIIGTWKENGQNTIETNSLPYKLILECKTQVKSNLKFPLEISIERPNEKIIIKKIDVYGERFGIDLTKFATYCFRLLPPQNTTYLSPSKKYCIELKAIQNSSPLAKPGEGLRIE